MKLSYDIIFKAVPVFCVVVNHILIMCLHSVLVSTVFDTFITDAMEAVAAVTAGITATQNWAT